jgi:hypothetical protein
MAMQAKIARKLFILPLAVALLAMGGCSVFTPRPVTPISEVVSLSAGDMNSDQVVSRVRGARTTYALKGSDFAELSRRGVTDAVLDELQQSLVADVDRLTRFWVLGESLGGCNQCYPQPVNLAMLDSGGSGMTDAGNAGRVADFSRPAGIPDWVPASPGRPGAPLISTADVLQMAKGGADGAQIGARIRDSRLDGIIANNGLRNISTQYSAGLKGSELAALSNQGVPAEALDALQAKFLAEYIEFARLRYQSWGKGSVPN